MERAVKEENISALKLDLAKAQSLVLADFRGVSVKADTSLRREFRLNGCRYQVVKNTLLGIAVKGTPMEGIEKLLAGPTAIAYSFEDPAAPAKIQRTGIGRRGTSLKRWATSAMEAGRLAGCFSRHCITRLRIRCGMGSPKAVTRGSGLGGSRIS